MSKRPRESSFEVKLFQFVLVCLVFRKVIWEVVALWWKLWCIYGKQIVGVSFTTLLNVDQLTFPYLEPVKFVQLNRNIFLQKSKLFVWLEAMNSWLQNHCCKHQTKLLLEVFRYLDLMAIIDWFLLN